MGINLIFSVWTASVELMISICSLLTFVLIYLLYYINISMIGNLKDQSDWCPLSYSHSLSALVDSLLLLSSHLLEMAFFLINSPLKSYFACFKTQLNLRVSLRPSWIPAPHWFSFSWGLYFCWSLHILLDPSQMLFVLVTSLCTHAQLPQQIATHPTQKRNMCDAFPHSM